MTTPADLITSKISPHNLETERAVLGGMLLDREILPKAFELLKSSDFYKDGHGMIFDAMLALFERNEPVDLLTMSEELRRRTELEEVGGPAALGVLVEEAATAANTGAYIDIIREYSGKRALITLGADLIGSAQNGSSVSDLIGLIDRRRESLTNRRGLASTVWDLARPARDLINEPDSGVLWLKEHLAAPGSITEIFSPRGLGKTHIVYAIGVEAARAGFRVLVLDRDNSKREVKRRLEAWGAADTSTFAVMTRDEVPPLTNPAKWAVFPFQDYDFVIVDSLDATTEGTGEQDSAKPSRAIAPLLDIAHRADGPAIVILGNTIKSGAHSRGSGVIEDRADICYEVRDATDLHPTGTKDWWLELPAAGVEAWANRATRRNRRDQYRLAFIPSKFRIGEEPLPFVFEIGLAVKPWTYRDVTAELVQAGEQNRDQAEKDRQAQREHAAATLRAEVEQRPLTTTEAVAFLMEECGLKRAAAREVIKNGQNTDWEIRQEAAKGSPKSLYPCISKASAAKIAGDETPLNMPVPAVPISADRMDTGRPKSTPSGPASTAAILTRAFTRPRPGKDPDEVSL